MMQNIGDVLLYDEGPDKLLPADDYITCDAKTPVKLRNYGTDIEPVSIVTFFKNVADSFPDNVALVDTFNDVNEVYTYRNYKDIVLKVAKVFIKLGLQPHKGVAILGFNSPQWIISYLACMHAGGLSTGIYPTNSSESCLHIMKDAECNIIIVENDEQVRKILKIMPQLTELKAIIQYRGNISFNESFVYSWEDIVNMEVDEFEKELQRRTKSLAPNKCCSLIYTSGTTGLPKGVMLSHDNILSTLQTLRKYLSDEQEIVPETLVSYLPLSHVAANMIDIYWPLITGGGSTYFAKPDALKDGLVKTLKVAKPTIFFGVPRVYEKFMEAMIACGKHVKQDMTGEEKEFHHKDIKLKLGLDSCELMIIGAAPPKQNVLDYFNFFGIIILEAYGLSETSGPHAVNVMKHRKMQSVGKTVPGFITKLLDLGEEGHEICMNGRHVFMGYLKNEEKTKESFDEDLWLRSGDVGYEDDDGFLYITARAKELLITAGGENIAPVPIETRVMNALPCISHAVLIGDQRHFLTMLLTLNSKVDSDTGIPKDELGHSAIEWCRSVGSNATTVSEIINQNDPSVMQGIQRGIDEANEGAVSRAQKIQKWIILNKDFSIAGGELGPTMKMKRKDIYKIYQKEINSLY